MTMLTSLKALLFPTPAQTGVKGDAAPTEGSAGFAQLLNSMGTTPTPVAQPITPAPVIENGDDGADNNVEYQHVDENSWRPTFAGTSSPTVSTDPASDIEKPQLAVQLAVARPESEATPAVAISASASTDPVTAKDVARPSDLVPINDIDGPADRASVAADAQVETAIPLPEQSEEPEQLEGPEQSEGERAVPSPTVSVQPADAAVAPDAVEQQSAPSPVRLHPVRPHEAALLDTPVQSLPAETPDAPEAEESASDDAKLAGQDDSQAPVQPTFTVMAPAAPATAPATAPTEPVEVAAKQVDVAAPSAVSRPAVAPTVEAQPASDTPVDGVNVAARSTPNTPASPAPATSTTATSTRSPVASGDVTSSLAEAAPLPSAATAPEASAMLPPSVKPVPIPVAQPSTGEPASDTTRLTAQVSAAVPMPAASPASASAPVPEAAVTPSVAVAAAPMAETVTTAAGATVAPDASEPAEAPDQAPDPTQAATSAALAKPRAEAVSLLQLVRDHMSLRAPRRTEAVTPVSEAKPDTAPIILPTAVNDGATPLAPLVQPAAQPLATAAPAMPTVDLSASLGAQVVDMGVSGQWIDGLARDIAGLSANGAQGRFQINATELGPIQVDIRQGDDGAAISLTVATEAAEQALRQDSDRLKLDAGLSAVRISDVKIERAPQPVEAARADGTASQNMAQHQSGGSSQNPGQAAGQNMGQSSAQSHMQGRGQQRENIAFGHKAGNDGAVLNHMDAGDTAGGAARARYA